jgi:hypothetical protein
MNLKINVDSRGHFEVFVKKGMAHKNLTFHSTDITHGVI